ncbi:MAG: HEAT repeat domain-containing protein [Blastocatellia bacterium]|nr:HEAT repeat domain-containing protein [Blastocatellia bacterium]
MRPFQGLWGLAVLWLWVPTIVQAQHVTPAQDPVSIRQKHEAQTFRPDFSSEQLIRQCLENPNPYLVARTLQEAPAPFWQNLKHNQKIIMKCLLHAHQVVRSTAIVRLAEFPSSRTASTVKPALKDPDPLIRAVAATLALRGGDKSAPLSCFEEILKNPGRGMPFGIDSQVRIPVTPADAYRAWVPLANPLVLHLCKAYPWTTPLGDEAFQRNLGKEVARNPVLIATLLGRTPYRDPYSYRQVICDAFRFAGPKVIPCLQEGLRSPDWCVRENAARACGAMKDSRLVPDLVAALDTDWASVHRTIAWALGEIQAPGTLPVLYRLYAVAKSAEQTEFGHHRSKPSGDFLTRLAALSSTLKEMKLAKPPKFDGYFSDSRIVVTLAAIAKFGPERSLEFYRILTQSNDSYSRQEATLQLERSAAFQ